METISKITILLFLTLTSNFSHATQGKHAPQLQNTLLWEIKGPGLERHSFLLGTIHTICKDDYKEEPRFKEVMKMVEQLFIEVSKEKLDTSPLIISAMTNDVPLKNRLSAAQYGQLEKLLNKHSSYDIIELQNMEMIAIMAALKISSYGCTVLSGEETLVTMAKLKDIPIIDLDTVAEQIRLANAMTPPIHDDAWTEDELKNFVMTPENYKNKISTHYSENLKLIYKEAIKNVKLLENGANFIDDFLDYRNQKWAHKIIHEIKQKPTLIAVGAVHLSGQKGLIKLLEEAGYTVTAVPKTKFND